MKLPEKKPYPVPRPIFTESMKPPYPRAHRCQQCHQFKTEGHENAEKGSATANKNAKHKLHTCVGFCTDFAACPTLYVEGEYILFPSSLFSLFSLSSLHSASLPHTPIQATRMKQKDRLENWQIGRETKLLGRQTS